MKEKVSITIDSKILRELDSVIDGIKIRNKSQAVEFLLRKFLSEERTAVILAGGPEEKLKFNGTIKPLVNISGKPVIDLMISQLHRYKFSKIFVIGRKNTLSEIFKEIGDGSSYGVEISYIEEKEDKSVTNQDSARTLKLLRSRIKSTFLCTYCDIILDCDLNSAWNFHSNSNSVATSILKTTDAPKKWGVAIVNGDKIIKFAEKPKKVESYLVSTGIFISEPEIFDVHGNSLEYDIFPRLAETEKLTGFVISGKCRHVHEHI